ncbi:hypothetical protein [Stenotrophomonas sp.]|uniref:hypothetical protein n=1 Tax=Stenotrophomonas sp. TaxID=69392 RepID=UPI0028A266D7|nr:hypothetical protein [Stenotrophomonas sp.]
MRRLTLPLLAVLALTGFKPYPPDPGQRSPVELSIVDRDQGIDLPFYSQRGQRWVAGQNGHPYSLRLYNRSPERVLVVLSVDGLNVISGQVAAPDQTGYVLEPWQRADITGWRKSQQEVAQFVFTDPGRSYASRTGRPDNIGVIGMAVFNEVLQFRPPVAPAAPMARERSQAAESADRSLSSVEVTGSAARAASAPAPALGTGHGARESSYAGSTEFRRASRIPVQQVAVRYDSERNLIARGIITRPRPIAGEPQAFPGQFVPDPPPYRSR